LDRFKDSEYADELFRVARTRPNPEKSLNADHGRLLLLLKRPKDAQPLLEQAVVDLPDFAGAWANLAFARLQNGDKAGACAAVLRGEALSPPPSVMQSFATVRREAAC
jgi:predicted Zn-dependent protease